MWTTNLSSTFSTAAGALKQTINAASSAKNSSAPPLPEGAVSTSEAPAAEKQYLRLPLESAKKLRWYDKVDLQALVRTHTREKRELLETIAVLKRVIIRSGELTETQLDEEVQQLLSHAHDLLANDEGVNSVLIISVQDELTELHKQHAQLQKDADELNAQLLEYRLHGPDPRFSIGSELMDATTPLAASAATLQLSSDLSAAVEEFEQYMAASTSLVKQIRRCEGDVSLAEAVATLKNCDTGSSAGAEGMGEEPPSVAGSAAMLAKLQRLEAERLSHSEEMAEMSGHVARLQEVAAEEEKCRAQLDASEERVFALTSIVDSLRAELCAAQAGLRAAEDAAERRAVEMKKLQQNQATADALRKYQDICLEAEARAAMAERKAVVAEARTSKLETSLKEAQADVKKRDKSLTAAQNEQGILMQRLAKVEGLTKSTRAVDEERRNEAANSKFADQVVAAEELQRSLRHQITALSSALSTSEQRCQSAEAREGRLMAELREAELLAHDREELYAQVMLLRDKLSEQRAEKGQAEQYKQVVHELEVGRSRLEEELMATAQLVTQLEARLREVLEKVDSSEMAVQLAEKRAREAEAAVASEVELRMSAACSSRAFWPAPIRDEVARIELRLTAMQTSLVAAQSQLDIEKAVLVAELDLKVEAQKAAAELEYNLEHMEGLVQAKQKELEDVQAEVEVARVVVLKLEAENVDLHHRLAMAAATASSRVSASSTGQNGQDGPNGMHCSKWQVANRVGGGTLYGVADQTQALQLSPHASTSSLSPHGSQNLLATPSRRGSTATSVDVMYLKNVLLKFLEASATGKVAERDVLLPAVATLLQATPAEFSLLRRLLQNTAPPATQVLSMFGIKY